MKTKIYALIFVCLGILISNYNKAQNIIGISRKDVEKYNLNLNDLEIEKKLKKNDFSIIYLRKATGNLTINASSSTDTYEAYFHIPVSYKEQVPILIDVESPHLIDYRFIHLNSPNLIIAARLNQAPSTDLNWTAWVLVKHNTYSGLPDTVPIPSLEQLPDSVKKWLQPTDCAQLTDSIIQHVADSIRGTTTNMMILADDICDYCYNIPWQFPHYPIAFDAVYAIKWGSSCTGHAHAGVALFRANGIPARTLLNIPVWATNFDQHWIIDYYVPEYGWVRMETSLGQNPAYAKDEIVTLVCNPEDEFPLFFPSGIEGQWHTSDPALGMLNPNWCGAHSGYSLNSIVDTTDKIEYAHCLTDSAFSYYTEYWGIYLTPEQQTNFQNAFNNQSEALDYFQNGDIDNYIIKMEIALNNYNNINPQPISTIFIDDFENGINNWTHGGTQDEWELGTPSFGPEQTHSGTNCWATDLDNTYENNADNWLLSPSIDLNGLACVYSSFWVWNWVEDLNQGYVYDPLWLDITTDGINFYPLCSEMGGVNDDPEIPDVGGWNMISLDLTKYVDNTVQIRFRFQSNSYIVQPGSYIDDFNIYGRDKTTVGFNEITQINNSILLKNYPNPFNSFTKIEYNLPFNSMVKLEIFNIDGRKIETLINKFQYQGQHSIILNTKSYTAGIYSLIIKVGNYSSTNKCVLIR